MKPGRKSKPGRRYPCGKRTSSQIQEDIMETAIEARMRIFGISKELAKSDAMGSPLGRLAHLGIISRNQADAGYDFAVTMRDYLATANLQKPTQGKAGFVPSQRSSSDSGEPVRGELKARAYMEALEELDRLETRFQLLKPHCDPQLSITATVWKVCISEEDIRGEAAYGALKVGLNAIHRIMYGRKVA